LLCSLAAVLMPRVLSQIVNVFDVRNSQSPRVMQMADVHGHAINTVTSRCAKSKSRMRRWPMIAGALAPALRVRAALQRLRQEHCDDGHSQAAVAAVSHGFSLAEELEPGLTCLAFWSLLQCSLRLSVVPTGQRDPPPCVLPRWPVHFGAPAILWQLLVLSS
jgi:hypothetical protein